MPAIQVSHSADASLVHIAGRFDFRCVKAFNAVLERKSPHWVVDMAEVEFVDSAALGLLLMLREHAGNGTVRLRGIKGQPREVVFMAKFDRLFALED
ncbi:MAG TPA: STAS domain-containing protein [Kofleriaceae bacterium]